MQYKMKGLIELCIARKIRPILFSRTSKKYTEKSAEFDWQLFVTGHDLFGYFDERFKNQALAARKARGAAKPIEIRFLTFFSFLVQKELTGSSTGPEYQRKRGT